MRTRQLPELGRVVVKAQARPCLTWLPSRLALCDAAGRFARRSARAGLVVLHGAARTGRHLGALAEAMKGYFTVHLVDRNGRGQSMPAKPEDGIDGQMDDIETVFSTTSARYLFGHSAGGMIALAAARKLHPDKLALYDPGISVDGSFPAVLVQRFETALANGNLAEAQARLARAVDAVPKWLPLPLLRVLLAGVIASPAGAETRKLLPTTSADFNLIVADDGPAQRFAEIGLRGYGLPSMSPAASPSGLTQTDGTDPFGKVSPQAIDLVGRFFPTDGAIC